MSLEDAKPTIEAQHLYSGKVFEIWAAWQADTPYNYVLGSTEQEVREAIVLRPVIVTQHLPDGSYLARCEKLDLQVSGESLSSVQKTLIRIIEARSGKLNWKHLALAMVDRYVDWETLCTPEEAKILRNELHKWQAGRGKVDS